MYLVNSEQQCRTQYKYLHSAIIQLIMQQFQSFWSQQLIPHQNTIVGSVCKLAEHYLSNKSACVQGNIHTQIITGKC